jgi:hypothetical protein
LFERQEVKTDKKKLKKVAKKVQKPQGTKVYRKRGRKPKKEKTSKVILKKLPELEKEKECRIELVNTTMHIDLNKFKPVLNLENEMFGSFEEIHQEIDNILRKKDPKTMLGDYHDHSTFNDSTSYSNTYLSSFEESKLSLYDENFKSSNSPSDIQNLNKSAIDFESQSTLRDNY